MSTATPPNSSGLANPGFSIDARVFVKHPKKSWLPGFVTARDAKGNYTVTDDDHDEVANVTDANITMCREDLLQEGIEPVVHDLLFLTVLHDATLLRCLRVRYLKDIVYTNIGAIVVALNPFNFKIPWYVDANMDKYLEEGDVIRANLPHSWAVAHNTYYEMMTEKRAQTVLVSGESGAGKTEACKMVMKYLGRVSMKQATPEQVAHAEAVRERIQQASPILEGFGNAKTVRNNNSSRFGKFVKVKFADEGYLAGAFTINYLLEKSRIVTASPNERAYHSLYYASKGKDANSWGLRPPTEYKSTFAGKCVNADGVDDLADYAEVRAAMTTVGISAEDQDNLWKVVAGVLVSMNIDLTPIDADITTIADHSKSYLHQTTELWGIPAEKYQKEVLTTTSTVRGETFVMNHRLAQACDARDSLTKHVYEKMFIWLVNQINSSTDNGQDTSLWIGVLDIFGFEDFEINSFEQVCINLTNETLQNHYNNYIFKRDMEECRAEGVNVDDVKCPDNSECLRLLAEGTGVLGLLDEECKLGTGTDDGFLANLIQHQSKSAFFDRKPTSKGNFIIKHYAGNVTYQVKSFLDKNRDTLKDDMKLMMRASTNPFAAQLLPLPVDRVGKTPTVGGFFKLQLAELMFLINATNPHWIRCIKPHPAKKPLMFDGLSTTNQLESSGVLGTVKIRKAGFPVRIYWQAFLARYKILIGRCSPQDPIDVLKEHVRKVMKASKTTQREVQAGKTRVFMKSEAYFLIEKARDEASVNYRIMLQAQCRSIFSQVKRRSIIWDQEIRVLQVEIKEYLKRSEEQRIARRRAREALVAAQKQAREDFVREAESFIDTDIFQEAEREYVDLRKHVAAHKQWLEDKGSLDMQEQLAFINMESRSRLEVFNESRNFLMQQRPLKLALHLMATPEMEEHTRRRVAFGEDREFALLLLMFKEHGAALFRAEIERAERRFRRVLLRLEDLQFTEVVSRTQMLPEFIVSLHRCVHPYGPILNSIKQYAATVVRRSQQRVTVKEQNEEIHFFSTRHNRDNAQLAKELLQIQVGSRTTVDANYRRQGDKRTPTVQWASPKAWQGITGVPDLDQVLSGATFDRRMLKGHRQGAGSPSETATTQVQVKAADIKAAAVFEAFADKHDEMQFLRMRHVLAEDFAALEKQGRYAGPYSNETTIPDKRAFYVAQDKLQILIQEFSSELVSQLRRLNGFCASRQIMEQNTVTGEWGHFVPAAPELLAKYPPCTDWRRLLATRDRLEYATKNYKSELLRIITRCIQRGARLSTADAQVDHTSTVERVHEVYFRVRGHFSACQRCLFPMATKATLVQLRLMWPHVQHGHFPDRCRECCSSAFDRDLALTLPTFGGSALATMNVDRVAGETPRGGATAAATSQSPPQGRGAGGDSPPTH